MLTIVDRAAERGFIGNLPDVLDFRNRSQVGIAGIKQH
jgi:hypothetical protein